MDRFNFKPGDRVKLSDGSEHTFLIDKRTVPTIEDTFISNESYPFLTIDDFGTTCSWSADGRRLYDSGLQLLPPEDWKYGTVYEDEATKRLWAVDHACKEDALYAAKNSEIEIPFRADFGRGAIEPLEEDDE